MNKIIIHGDSNNFALISKEIMNSRVLSNTAKLVYAYSCCFPEKKTMCIQHRLDLRPSEMERACEEIVDFMEGK